MVNRLPRRAMLVFPLILPVVCVAQRYVPPPPPLTVDPCVVKTTPQVPVAVDPKAKAPVCPPPAAAPPAQAPSGSAPSAAEQFPFPGSAPAKTEGKPGGSTADQFPYPGGAGAPGAGASAPAAKTGPPASGAGGQFPYPGETSASPDAVPEGNVPRYVPDSPAPGEKGAPAGGAPLPSGSGDDSSSSSSSSSSSDNSSGGSSGDDAGAAPAGGTPAGDRVSEADAGGDPHAAKGRRHLPKVSAQSADERVAEDLSVANFYSERGNYQAAYMRGKDATTLMPNDPEGHFALAEAARRLQKKDEAAAEYALYLKLDPGGDKMAAAEKALSQLR